MGRKHRSERDTVGSSDWRAKSEGLVTSPSPGSSIRRE